MVNLEEMQSRPLVQENQHCAHRLHGQQHQQQSHPLVIIIMIVTMITTYTRMVNGDVLNNHHDADYGVNKTSSI